MSDDVLVTRLAQRLLPDASRVVAPLFVPGHYVDDVGEGRASGVVERILALTEEQVVDAMADVSERFGCRHRDLSAAFLRHADRIANRLDSSVTLSAARRLLLGATFTHEYAVEAAALCNPSAVAHPDQSGLTTGSLRFVMSVRQIGEGHRSSVGFRTGVISAHGDVSIEDTAPFATSGVVDATRFDVDVFCGLVERYHEDTEAIRWVLDRLADDFTADELEVRLRQLEAQRDTRRNASRAARRLREQAARMYTATFDPTSQISERVLYPAIGVESNGIEDARFVRFVETDGSVLYHATYTAYDGGTIRQQLLITEDFLTFVVSPLVGAGAANKGLALFPRRVGGRFAALSRHDGSSNGIAFSDDIRQWPTVAPLECPSSAWEAIQRGNCGPPIETERGWLVLTHGVGPMRTYSIGAWLLDLQNPSRVIGRLREPLLSPAPDEQDGYVPNVLYSCGAVQHGDILMLPYGIGDSAIGFATASVSEVVGAMEPVG